MSESKKLIFAHAMFRTGSTWLWNQFRHINDCRAYCEPLHEFLASINQLRHEEVFHSEKHTEKLRHPQLKNNYFHEYPISENGEGVSCYKERFAFSRYVLDESEQDEELEIYLRNLITWCPEKIIVFQPCRSAHRSRWMKHRYGGLHLYLLRNPRDQWASYVSFDSFEQERTAFFTMTTLLIASANADTKWFSPLREIFPLIEIPATPVGTAADIWHRAAYYISPYKRYFLFMWHWYTALLDNLSTADIVIDYDSLANDEVRRELEERIGDYMGVQFSMKPFQQSENNIFPLLSESQMNEIEIAVASLLHIYFPNECARVSSLCILNKEKWHPLSQQLLTRLTLEPSNLLQNDFSGFNQYFPAMRRIQLSQILDEALMPTPINAQSVRAHINSLAHENKYLLEEIDQLRSSEAFRLGHLLILPLAKLKKIFNAKKT